MDTTLEKIDLIRERTGLSYAEAKNALEEASGDVVEALVMLEEEQYEGQEPYKHTAGNLFAPIKHAISQGNRTRIRVKNRDGILLEIPATLGLAGAFLAPKITALGAIAILLARYSLEVEPAGQDDTGWDN